MNRKDLTTRILLISLPAIAAGAALSFLFVVGRADFRGLVAYTAVLASLTLFLAVEACWLFNKFFRARPRLTRIGQERDFLARRAKFLESRLALLEESVEVLSAMRQVARAAAAHDGLDRVLEETLHIIQDLISADWVTVFVHDEKSGALVPRAHRRGLDSYLGTSIPPGVIDDTNVAEAFRFESVIKQVESDRLLAAVPALSGGAKLGVVAVSAPLSGTSDEKAQRVEMFESALKDIAETIAYALRAVTLQTRAYEDDLTGLGNRGLFDERLAETVALSLRKNQPLSLILVDIDRFKEVNDTHGHQVGDRVLREVAALLAGSLRRYDTAYRYGGEELALILPQTVARDAATLAERIRAKLEKKSFLSKKLRVTASFGVASLGGQTLSEVALIAAADAELYKAKSNGRNRVEPASLVTTRKP